MRGHLWWTGLISVQDGPSLLHLSPRSDDPCPAPLQDHGAEEIVDEEAPCKLDSTSTVPVLLFFLELFQTIRKLFFKKKR